MNYDVFDLSGKSEPLGTRRFAGTRVVKIAAPRVIVYLEKELLDVLCPDTDSKLAVLVDSNSRRICVLSEEGLQMDGSKVYRNNGGSGKFYKTISKSAFDSLFPNEARIYWPSSVEVTEINQKTCVILFPQTDEKKMEQVTASLESSLEISAQNSTGVVLTPLLESQDSENQPN